MRRPLPKISHQALLAVLFGAQFEYLLFPKEIHRKSTCDAVRKLLHRRALEIFRVVLEKERVASFVKFNQLGLNDGAPWRATILQVIHLPFEERILGE